MTTSTDIITAPDHRRASTPLDTRLRQSATTITGAELIGEVYS